METRPRGWVRRWVGGWVRGWVGVSSMYIAALFTQAFGTVAQRAKLFHSMLEQVFIFVLLAQLALVAFAFVFGGGVAVGMAVGWWWRKEDDDLQWVDYSFKECTACGGGWRHWSVRKAHLGGDDFEHASGDDFKLA